jgi:hypothetical protein
MVNIRDNDSIQQFRQAFSDIKKHIFNQYIEIVFNLSNASTYGVSASIRDFLPKLYKAKSDFRAIVARILRKPDIDNRVKRDIRSFFELQSAQARQPADSYRSTLQSFIDQQGPSKPQRIEMLTPRQETFLGSRGVLTAGMTKSEASRMIGNIKQQER